MAVQDLRFKQEFVRILGLGGKYMLDHSDNALRPRLRMEGDDFVYFGGRAVAKSGVIVGT